MIRKRLTRTAHEAGTVAASFVLAPDTQKTWSGAPPTSELTTADDLMPDEAPFEMANLRPERTGLPFVVFISQQGGAKHDVRVKVARGPRVRPEEMVSVALRPVPRVISPGVLDASDLAILAAWVERNRDVLVRYWTGEIAYTEDAIAALRPIGEIKQ